MEKDWLGMASGGREPTLIIDVGVSKKCTLFRGEAIDCIITYDYRDTLMQNDAGGSPTWVVGGMASIMCGSVGSFYIQVDAR
jgi:hypothetical protein